jgi:hypothetical protein
MPPGITTYLLITFPNPPANPPPTSPPLVCFPLLYMVLPTQASGILPGQPKGMNLEQFWGLCYFCKWHSWYWEKSQIISFLPFTGEPSFLPDHWKSFCKKGLFIWQSLFLGLSIFKWLYIGHVPSILKMWLPLGQNSGLGPWTRPHCFWNNRQSLFEVFSGIRLPKVSKNKCKN